MTNATVEVAIPPQLEEMIDKMFGDLDIPEHHEPQLAYDHGWIVCSSKEEYAALIERNGIPSDPGIVKILCELAIMRAMVRWHEIRNEPPPMPSIKSF